MHPPRLQTPRLILTWPSPEQIDGYHQAIVGTDMFDTILWDGPTSDRDLHDYWAHVRSQGGWDQPLSVALVERDSGHVVGGAALRPVDGQPRILDLGYALAPRFHGRGYATEAVRALVDHGFASRGAERIFASVFVGNVASRRVAEKAGMRFEGTLRHVVYKRRTWRDEWIFAIVRPDWIAAIRGQEGT